MWGLMRGLMRGINRPAPTEPLEKKKNLFILLVSGLLFQYTSVTRSYLRKFQHYWIIPFRGMNKLEVYKSVNI